MEHASKKYVAFDKDDPHYFGAKEVIKKEWEYIRFRRSRQICKNDDQEDAGGKKASDDKAPDRLTGLALSGGGIRSASFALGIMQALAYNGWLEKIDYLSTVSGGGYIGSSLTWLLSSIWKGKDENGREVEVAFNTGRDRFPYATYPISGKDREKGEEISLEDRIKKEGSHAKLLRGKMLAFLRQNAKYLTPGGGLNLFAFIFVVFRASIMSLGVYLGLLTLLFFILAKWKLLTPLPTICPLPEMFAQNWLLAAAGAGLALFAFTLPLYSLGTFLFSRTYKGLKTGAYAVRRGYERAAGYVLPIIFLLGILGSVPPLYAWITQHSSADAKQPEQAGRFVITGTHAADGTVSITGDIKYQPENRGKAENGVSGNESAKRIPDQKGRQTAAATPAAQWNGFWTGLAAVILGIASGIRAFVKTSRLKPGKIPMSVYVSVGGVALLFGLMLLAYSFALLAIRPGFPLPALAIAVPVLLGYAFWVNINHISAHRYYRDRLMETFMPDMADIIANRDSRCYGSKQANEALLHDMCRRGNSREGFAVPGPYHIINTNAVLVSSRDRKFRGRGGDNFILSPAYCGSAATGWHRTDDYMKGTLTLATAMAVSGAALNPSAGCGGGGITRQPILSILMGLLNVRLGCWLPNPRLETNWYHPRVPNYILPGLWEIIWRKGLNEHGWFLQLSDGGHFENLALYELIRRKLELIIVCDGSADPNFAFGDLANVIEKVRADFGALINIFSHDLKTLIPIDEISSLKAAEKAYLKARIVYADNTTGILIYLTTTFFKELTADLYGYKKSCNAFPDEPTSDQFFDEKQFEAYRELGFQAAWRMMNEIGNDSLVQNIMP